ncbi:MAG: thioredoxin family protein [Planctomycetota bacterium]
MLLALALHDEVEEDAVPDDEQREYQHEFHERADVPLRPPLLKEDKNLRSAEFHADDRIRQLDAGPCRGQQCGMKCLKIEIVAGFATAAALALLIVGCSSPPADAESQAMAEASDPPAAIREWMDRLTVDHEYDPETGFIVAKEVIGLPPVIADGPSLGDAVREGVARSRPVVVFATADRCAPCQQYKKSALNDPAVVAALSSERFVVTHIEVDRSAEQADAILGSRAIPMTYVLRNGERAGVLRGQRSAEELLAWLDTIETP